MLDFPTAGSEPRNQGLVQKAPAQALNLTIWTSVLQF